MSPRKTKLYMELVSVVILCATAIIYFSIHQTTLLTLVGGFPPLPAGESWQQEFDDEFDSFSIDPSKWVTCFDNYNRFYNGCTDVVDGDLQWYRPGQVEEHDGYAQLTATQKTTFGASNSGSGETYHYRSGMISTGRQDEQQKEPLVPFQYGFFEARIRMTSGKGIAPSFALVPANESALPSVDIMQVIGDEPQQVLLTYHWGLTKSPQESQTIFSPLTYFNNWHTYALDWEPGHLDWYVDGILRKSITGREVPNQPMELQISLSVGGNGSGTPDNQTTLPARMDIDYVRVYRAVLKGS